MKDRILPLEGVRNFRDFGGYALPGGGLVVRGRLFRSAHLDKLTIAGKRKFDALGVRLVADLRRPHERTGAVTSWPIEGGARMIFGTQDDGSEPPHIAFFRLPELTRGAVARFMEETYRAIPFDPFHLDIFSRFLQALVHMDGAVLVHCAAGKDRTGVLCAITLAALGVPEEVIIKDYEFTNVAIDLENRLPALRADFLERHKVEALPESLLPVLGVNRDYLVAAFDEIRRRSGSLDGYLDQLGMVAHLREQLKRRLTV